jgi:hypothetical protein
MGECPVTKSHRIDTSVCRGRHGGKLEARSESETAKAEISKRKAELLGGCRFGGEVSGCRYPLRRSGEWNRGGRYAINGGRANIRCDDWPVNALGKQPEGGGSALDYQKKGRGSSSPEIIFSPSRTARLHRQCSSTGHAALKIPYTLLASTRPILNAALRSSASASVREEIGSTRLPMARAPRKLFRASVVQSRSASAAISQALAADLL